jgi:hypothetical protein
MSLLCRLGKHDWNDKVAGTYRSPRTSETYRVYVECCCRRCHKAIARRLPSMKQVPTGNYAPDENTVYDLPTSLPDEISSIVAALSAATVPTDSTLCDTVPGAEPLVRQ